MSQQMKDDLEDRRTIVPSLSRTTQHAHQLQQAETQSSIGVAHQPSAELQPLSVPDPTLAVEPDIGPPPDGGRNAWLCIFGAFCLVFCIIGFNTSFGQLQVYYLSHQLKDHTADEVGWISSITFFILYVFSMFFGRYFDSHGPIRLLIAGTIIQVGAMIGIAFSKNYWQLFLSHTGLGVAGTLLYAPATAIAGQWFLRRRSTAIGIVICGSGLGGVTFPLMIKRLIEQLDFRKCMLIIAGLNGVLMIIACLTVRCRLPPKAPPAWKSLLKPWKESRYVCLVAGSGLVILNWASPYFLAPDYASSNNASPTVQGYAVVFIQTGSFVGRITSGVIADRFGVWKAFVGFGLLASIFLFSLWTPTGLSDAPIVIGLIAFGYASGAWVTLVAASCAAISPIREVGTRLGMLWSFAGLPALIGPVVCGALVTGQDGLLTHAAIFCGFTILLGTIITDAPVLISKCFSLIRARKTQSLEEGIELRTVEDADDKS